MVRHRGIGAIKDLRDMDREMDGMDVVYLKADICENIEAKAPARYFVEYKWGIFL